MPFSSSSLTREASEKRGGGRVKCCLGSSRFRFSDIPAGKRRQDVPVFFAVDLIVGGAIQSHKTRKLDRGPAGIEQVGAGFYGDRILIDQGRLHLGGDKPLPDQTVYRASWSLDKVRRKHLRGCHEPTSRPDGLVGILHFFAVFKKPGFGQGVAAPKRSRIK